MLLAGLKTLEYLFLNENQHTGPVPVGALAALPEIKSIYLSNNKFQDTESSHAALLTALNDSRGAGHGVEVDMLGHGLLYYGNEYQHKP